LPQCKGGGKARSSISKKKKGRGCYRGGEKEGEPHNSPFSKVGKNGNLVRPSETAPWGKIREKEVSIPLLEEKIKEPRIVHSSGREVKTFIINTKRKGGRSKRL